MIRYVEQQDIDLAGNLQIISKSIKEQTNRRGNRNPSSVQVPEIIDNSSNALKKLKRTDDQYDMLKRRLSVLQLHQQKNSYKALSNQRKYEFHMSKREQLSKEKADKEQFLRKMYLNLMKTRQQVYQEKKNHQENLKKAQNQIYSSKVDDYKEIKNLITSIEKTINENKEEESTKNREKKEKINEYERFQRNKVQNYLSDKKKEIRMNESREGSKLSERKKQREEQLQQLSELEGIMLERQARSRVSYEQSQSKLKSFLKVTERTKARGTKLPSLSTSTDNNHTNLDFVIL